eukprot:8658023-Pyramimonas_sp.AAC.1
MGLVGETSDETSDGECAASLAPKASAKAAASSSRGVLAIEAAAAAEIPIPPDRGALKKQVLMKQNLLPRSARPRM